LVVHKEKVEDVKSLVNKMTDSNHEELL
jgi:hypothetical protein